MTRILNPVDRIAMLVAARNEKLAHRDVTSPPKIGAEEIVSVEAIPSAKRPRRPIETPVGHAQVPEARKGLVWESESPAAGDVSILGWDPEKVESTKNLLGKQPPFQISFSRSAFHDQSNEHLIPSAVKATMDAIPKSQTGVLESQADQMSALDLAICSTILQAQASVFTWKAHHQILEDMQKLSSAEEKEKKSSEELKRQADLVIDLRVKVAMLEEKVVMLEEKVAMLEKARNLAQRKLDAERAARIKVGQELEAARLVVERKVIKKYKSSLEYKYDMSMTYIHAYQDIIRIVQQKSPDLDVGVCKEFLANYLRDNPLPASYLDHLADLKEFTPPGFVANEMIVAPPIKHIAGAYVPMIKKEDEGEAK